MAVLTPLTVKSTKSMAAMQALGPEMKKLQQKYKGSENRAQLNEEMMKLYKEHKVNPASGCLPMLLQMPAFLVLYDVIRGITNTVTINGRVVPQPRYISHNTKMYRDIIASHGQLNSFGMDFAKKLLPFGSHGGTFGFVPYLLLVLASVALQYLQMKRLNARNPQASANPQAAMLQKYMPIVFGLIYLNIPAAVNVYFIVSSAIRIGTQEILFRRGMVGAAPAPAERENPPRLKQSGSGDGSRGDRARPSQKSGSSSKSAPSTRPGAGRSGARPPAKADGSSSTRNGNSRPAGAKSGSSGSRTTPPTSSSGKKPSTAKTGTERTGNRPAPSNRNGAGGNGTGRPRGSRNAVRASDNSTPENNGDGSGEPKAHPRSKSKRDRKAR